MNATRESASSTKAVVLCIATSLACLIYSLCVMTRVGDAPAVELSLQVQTAQPGSIRLKFDVGAAPTLRPVELPVDKSGEYRIALPFIEFARVDIGVEESSGMRIQGAQWRFPHGYAPENVSPDELGTSASSYALAAPASHMRWAVYPARRAVVTSALGLLASLTALIFAVRARSRRTWAVRACAGLMALSSTLVLSNTISRTAQVTVLADVMAPDAWQVFVNQGSGFNESDSASVLVQPRSGPQKLVFSVQAQAPRKLKFRLDPGEGAGKVLLRSICFGKRTTERCWFGPSIVNIIETAESARLFPTPNGVEIDRMAPDPRLLITGDFRHVMPSLNWGALTAVSVLGIFVFPLLGTFIRYAYQALPRCLYHVYVWLKRTEGSQIAILLAFLALSAAFLARLHTDLFIDEADNFVGGMILGRGLRMYKDFYSQHTPLIYHLVSWAYRIGIREEPYLRLFWLALTGSIVYLIYRLQRPAFGAIPSLVLLWGLAIGVEPYWPHLVLSDGMQALGLVLTFYIFARFERVGTMPKSHMLLLGVGAWAAIMSAFLSVYPLFFLALAFVCQELRAIYRNPEQCSSLARYVIFLSLAAAPFLCSLLFYWSQGSLGAFYYQAYVFNRVHYGNYGAMTKSVGAVFLQYSLSVDMLKEAFTKLAEGEAAPSLYLGSGAALAALISIAAFYHRRPIIAFLMAYFVLMCGVRAVHTHFHALPFYAACLGALGLGLANTIKQHYRVYLHVLSAVVSIYIIDSHAQQAFDNVTAIPTRDLLTARDHFVVDHSDADDTIWQGDLNSYTYVHTGRLPASRMTDVCPWFWDAYKEDLLADLRKAPPKFVYLNPNIALFGKRTSEYAVELMQFLQENYEPPPPTLSPPEGLLVRKGAMLLSASPPIADG